MINYFDLDKIVKYYISYMDREGLHKVSLSEFRDFWERMVQREVDETDFERARQLMIQKNKIKFEE